MSRDVLLTPHSPLMSRLSDYGPARRNMMAADRGGSLWVLAGGVGRGREIGSVGEPADDGAVTELSPAQRRVVSCSPTDGHLLVLAGPGAGKTRTIVERICWLIDEGHGRAEHILAMSFTTEAAAELRDRLARRGLAGVATGTFHHVCGRLLTEHGRAVGVEPPLRVYEERRQEAVLRRAARQAGCPLDRRGAPRLLDPGRAHLPPEAGRAAAGRLAARSRQAARGAAVHRHDRSGR